MHTKPTSAYVHIPFCTQICFYCDFSKVFIKNQPVDAYLEHLIQEFRREEITNLRTLYIGGGTPTALTADQLAYLLKELTKSLDLSQMEELTIEANPGDLDPDKIAVLKLIGFHWACRPLIIASSRRSVGAIKSRIFMTISTV